MPQVAIIEDGLTGRMAAARAEAVRTALPLPWAQVLVRWPVVSAFAVFGLGMVILRWTSPLFHTPEDYRAYMRQGGNLLGEIVACLLLVVVISALGWWRAAGFTPPRRWQDLWLLWLPVVTLPVLLWVQWQGHGVTADPRWLGIALPYTLLVAFYEEALIRGLVLFLLLYAWRGRPHGVPLAVLVSSAMVALAHLLNATDGHAIEVAFVEVGVTAMLGVGLAGLLLRTNTIWFGIVWHGAAEAIRHALSGPHAPDSHGAREFVPLLLFLPVLVYGLILIRKRDDTVTWQRQPGRAKRR